MSIPSGVTTVLVSVLPQTSIPVVTSTITVSAVPSMDLQWSATGQRLSSMCGVSPTPGWLQLPAVDQLGFITLDTRMATTGWSYVLSIGWTGTDGARNTASGTVQCFSNQTVQYLADVNGALVPVVPNTVLAMTVLSSSQYSALVAPDPNTLYFTY